MRKVNPNQFNFSELTDKGRLQYFYHSPSSKLPIRDVFGAQGAGCKTEPHIEIKAENFVNKCQQPSIIGFLKGDEKYLFLFTRHACNSEKEHYKQYFIVGYIVKGNYIDRGNHYAVIGETKLFSFENAFPLDKIERFKGLENARYIKKKLLGEETKRIVEHFKDKENILKECVDEIKKLERLFDKQKCEKCHIEEDFKEKGEQCKLKELRETDCSGCEFKNECMRYAI